MDPFYDICFITHVNNSCYLGFSVLFFGLILLILNSYAFIKMTKYYGKMNFENTILLLSSIQSILLLVELIIAQKVLISVFIFIQILSICLINFKFKKISREIVKLKYIYLSKIIIIINIIYLFAFITIYVIEKIKDIDIVFYLSIFYYILEFFTAFLLSYNCCIFLGIIKKNQSFNNNDLKHDNNKKQNYFLQNNMMGDGLFYLIKKRQMTLLYLGNILCSFFILILDITINFIIDEDNSLYDYIYYSFFLFCFIQNSINFICFYWLIREQYNPKVLDININVGTQENNDNKLIDEKYIEEEIVNIENENERISGYIYGDKNEKEKRSISFNSDTIITKKNYNNLIKQIAFTDSENNEIY